MGDMKDANWAFAQYENVRASLPQAKFPASSQNIKNIGEVADQFDVYLLDAFGVLNVGESVIAGAPAQVAALQMAGKHVFVLTNGASLPADVSLAKYRKLGFDFQQSDVIASRDALAIALRTRPEKHWGVMALDTSRLGELPVKTTHLMDDPAAYDAVDAFFLIGSGQWTEPQQNLLIKSLHKHPRSVLVGNPDIVAPREYGLSLEPGWFAHDLTTKTCITPEFYGKPFANVFDLALSKIPSNIPRERIVMVGDTLHTDVLGGAAMGMKTILITDHGLFKGKDITPYIEASGIIPDFIAKTT